MSGNGAWKILKDENPELLIELYVNYYFRNKSEEEKQEALRKVKEAWKKNQKQLQK